jgi:hypothetical protein
LGIERVDPVFRARYEEASGAEVPGSVMGHQALFTFPGQFHAESDMYTVLYTYTVPEGGATVTEKEPEDLSAEEGVTLSTGQGAAYSEGWGEGLTHPEGEGVEDGEAEGEAETEGEGEGSGCVHAICPSETFLQ